MASPVTAPRGMRDFLPAEKARRERALRIIRDTYRAHGFDEIETPVMEDAARLHAGLGGDNEKLAFAVLRRGLTGDDLRAAAEAEDALLLADLGLRFDLTVPLTRFYASHRAELPGTFRAVQIAPVWRAERPQKGRYRQFMQCDIDIIGEAGPLAEVELITATTATLDALGLTGATVRINDRRLLTAMLDALGFPEESHPSVLITVDKLDKVGAEGVAGELRGRGAPEEAVLALEQYLGRDTGVPAGWGPDAIRAALPAGVDEGVIGELAELGASVNAVRGDDILVFDPFLVRGMGYYTGTIFEIAHPASGSSLGGGGRYDGMIGRFLGTDVPACGFSIGFERIVDLVADADAADSRSIVLIAERDVPLETLVRLKSELVKDGGRVRIERRVKNVKALLERSADAGYGTFANVSADSRVETLDIRPLG